MAVSSRRSSVRYGPLSWITRTTANHPALARRLQDYLRWRNAHARHPGVLAAQRRERARVRSERQQRWGPEAPAACRMTSLADVHRQRTRRPGSRA